MGHFKDYVSECFSCQSHGHLAVIRLNAGVFEIGTDLTTKDEFFSHLHDAAKSQEIKAIIVLNSDGVLGDQEYGKFLLEHSRTLRRKTGDSYADDFHYSRQENAVTQLIEEIHACPKYTAACLQGEIAAPFFGTSLAFDFRLVSEDMRYSLAYADLGVPPTGALPYFLPLHVGMGKAVEIIAAGEPVPAHTAASLGLANAVLPEAEFEEHCLEWVEDICRMPLHIIQSTKALLRAHEDGELERYFQKESNLFLDADLKRS